MCIHIIFFCLLIFQTYEILSFYPPLRSFSLARSRSQFFFRLYFFLFFLFYQSFSHRREHANLRVSRDSFIIGSFVSSRVLLLFFFYYPLLFDISLLAVCDSLWSIIVTASRMISRRRSASSSFSLPWISRWRITRTIIKIRTLFHPLVLSLTSFHFPSLFFFRFCISRILKLFSKAHM